jgi:hypothetical protein
MATTQSILTDQLMTALPLWEARNVTYRISNGTASYNHPFAFTRLMDGVAQVDFNLAFSCDLTAGTSNISSGASVMFVDDVRNYNPGNPLPAHPTFGSNYTRYYFIIPADVAPGDTFHITSTNGDTLNNRQIGPALATDDDAGATYFNGDDLTPVLPNAKAAPGRGDRHNPTGTVKPPFRMGQPTATPPNFARQFVIYENRDDSHGGGRLLALDPNIATGLPLPSFRIVTALPATGTTLGEAIVNRNSGLSYVWDGARWVGIVPPAIVGYTNDAAILADTAANAGTYAFSRTTGNLFVRYNNGTNDVWRELGIMTFPTEAGLLTATPANGQIAYAIDSGNYWARQGTSWEPFGINRDTQAQILAANYADGAVAFAIDTGNTFLRTNATWQPITEYQDTEANILAATYPNNTKAIATDTGNSFIRVNGAWQPDLMLFDTEANIIASTYHDGSLAYATDTNQYWVKTAGAWQPLDVVSNTNTNILASTPRDGTVAYATDLHLLWFRIDGAWQPGSIPHDTTANILAATFYEGARCYATDSHIIYVRVNGNWVPESYLRDTEANIRAATPINGLIAVATDTGKVFYGDGANWLGQPFRDYPTEAGLIAATPLDNVVAVAVDTGRIFYRTGGNWINLNGSNVPSGNTDPVGASAGNTQGDMFFNLRTNQLKVWDGTSWKSTGAGVIGGLSDVDTTTTAPVAKNTLVWDDTAHLWKPGKGGGVEVSEPPVAERYDGMLWHDGIRLWVWRTTPTAWIEC